MAVTQTGADLRSASARTSYETDRDHSRRLARDQPQYVVGAGAQRYSEFSWCRSSPALSRSSARLILANSGSSPVAAEEPVRPSMRNGMLVPPQTIGGWLIAAATPGSPCIWSNTRWNDRVVAGLTSQTPMPRYRIDGFALEEAKIETDEPFGWAPRFCFSTRTNVHVIFRIGEDVPELRLYSDNPEHGGRECLFVQALGGRYHGRMTLVTCSRSGEVRQNPMHKYGISGCGLCPRWNFAIGSL